VHGAWWFITVWVWALGVIYFVRYRSGRWKSMRVIEQVHHHAMPLESTNGEVRQRPDEEEMMPPHLVIER